MIFPIDFEHVHVNGIKPARLLEGNTKSILISLTGRLVDTPFSLPPQHQSPQNPNEFISKYPHSNTGSSTVSQSPPIRSNKILPVQTVSFRDTLVKSFGGTCMYTLDFNNESLMYIYTCITPSGL